MDDRRSRIERLLKGDRVSPLELLVGPENYARSLATNATLWASIVVGGGGAALLLAGPHLGLNRPVIAAFVLFSIALIISIPVAGTDGVRLYLPILALVAGLLMATLVWLAGPGLAVTAALLPGYASAVFLFFNRRTATVAVALASFGYALAVLLADGYPRPLARIVFVGSVTISTGIMIGRFLGNLETLSRSERALHVEVESARALLQERVAAQVDEIERLGKLRRFLSPQVADTVLSSGGDDLLATHRRQIAVIFLDLRGFTGFSAVAEPEDVVEVLTEFYAAVGKVVKRSDATVGGFAGDGIMAYFNDPVPCDDPAGRALEMALSLRDPMALLKDKWRERGFDIGYGAGVAYGYATLGTIGFEARTDYTPIGSVVNLASRLCDEAGDGEVLLDSRAHIAVDGRVDADAVQLDLKGFNGPVMAYRIALGASAD